MEQSIETLGEGKACRVDRQMETLGTNLPPSTSSRDIHHDPWLVPASTALMSYAASIFENLESIRPKATRQRADAKERRRAIVMNIAASLALLVRSHAEGSRLAVPAKKDAATRYDRRGFNRDVLMQIIEGMETLGLLHLKRGARGQHRTTIEPTSGFRHRVAAMEIGIGRVEGAETIILKANTGRRKPKALIDYEDTAETEAMRAEMATVNTMLSDADIKLDSMPPTLPPFLTRRFQIDHPDALHTFDQHGRLYGGFWMSMEKTERHLLSVNGEPVVDLDFTGMFVQLAYREAGLALPNSDPYEGIEGLPRAAAKLGLSALLCRSGPMRRLPAGIRELAGNAWSAKRLNAALVGRHPGIAHLFGSGLGLRLMKTESEILLATLGQLFEQGIPALPMHDGLMVPASSEEAARRAMVRASMRIVGVTLPITKKQIARPNNDNSPPMD